MIYYSSLARERVDVVSTNFISDRNNEATGNTQKEGMLYTHEDEQDRGERRAERQKCQPPLCHAAREYVMMWIVTRDTLQQTSGRAVYGGLIWAWG